MPVLLSILAVFFILATLCSMSKSDAWWLRIFDFPRVQIFVVGLVVLITSIAFWGLMETPGRVLLGLLLLSLIYQAALIIPYLPFAPKNALAARRHDPANHISILVANVLMSNRNAGDLLQLIEDKAPDLVLTVETDDWWAESLSVLEAHYPHSVVHPLDNTYGMILYARYPLEAATLYNLLEEGVPSIFAKVRLPSGDATTLVCLHPRPPRPDKLQDSTQRDAELLLVAKMMKDEAGPIIIAGDLNDVAWSHTTRLFQRISGLLDPRRGRGFFSTFHAEHTLLRWPLDHVFLSHHYRVVTLERLPYFGSDHFPIYAKLSLEPEHSHEQETQVPDANDEAEAEKLIENGRNKI